MTALRGMGGLFRLLWLFICLCGCAFTPGEAVGRLLQSLQAVFAGVLIVLLSERVLRHDTVCVFARFSTRHLSTFSTLRLSIQAWVRRNTDMYCMLFVNCVLFTFLLLLPALGPGVFPVQGTQLPPNTELSNRQHVGFAPPAQRNYWQLPGAEGMVLCLL